MKTVTLGDVATVRSSLVDPKQRRFANMPHIAPDSLERNTGQILSYRTVAEDGVTSGKYLFQSGDLLYSKIRPNLNKVAIAEFSGLCSADMYAIRTTEDVLSTEYLAHLLRSDVFLEYAAAMSNRANIPKLNRQQLLGFTLDLPTLCEQRRIAAILDHADALRAKRRQVLTHFDALAQSIFSDMFGDVRSNEKGLDVATIEEVADRVTDGEHKTPRRSDRGVPLLSARNIRDGWIDFKNVDYVEEDVYAVLSRRLEPRTGDILISCSGTIGRVAQVRQQFRFAMVRSAALIRPNSMVTPTFLERLLATPVLKGIMLSQANSSAQANLFQNQIRRLPVLVPSLSDQEIFARRIERVDRQANSARRALGVASELFASLQSRAFREGL